MRFTLLVSLSLAICSCVQDPNGSLRRSSNGHMVDRNHSLKRLPEFNGKYIQRAKYNLANLVTNGEENELDSKQIIVNDDIEETIDAATQNRIMYQKMIIEDLKKVRKKEVIKRDAPQPNIVDNLKKTTNVENVSHNTIQNNPIQEKIVESKNIVVTINLPIEIKTDNDNRLLSKLAGKEHMLATNETENRSVLDEDFSTGATTQIPSAVESSNKSIEIIENAINTKIVEKLNSNNIENAVTILEEYENSRPLNLLPKDISSLVVNTKADVPNNDHVIELYHLVNTINSPIYVKTNNDTNIFLNSTLAIFHLYLFVQLSDKVLFYITFPFFHLLGPEVVL